MTVVYVLDAVALILERAAIRADVRHPTAVLAFIGIRRNVAANAASARSGRD